MTAPTKTPTKDDLIVATVSHKRVFRVHCVAHDMKHDLPTYYRAQRVRFISQMVIESFIARQHSNFGRERTAIGPLLTHFPMLVRVNRHHRRRYAVAEPFSEPCVDPLDSTKLYGGILPHPARISELIAKKKTCRS